jgi:hypothetical protein
VGKTGSSLDRKKALPSLPSAFHNAKNNVHILTPTHPPLPSSLPSAFHNAKNNVHILTPIHPTLLNPPS